MTSPAEIRAHILAFVSGPQDAPDDFDLRQHGGIDSLGFVQLLADIEAKIGTTVDLSPLDPTDLTKVAVLSRHIAAQLAAQELT